MSNSDDTSKTTRPGDLTRQAFIYGGLFAAQLAQEASGQGNTPWRSPVSTVAEAAAEAGITLVRSGVMPVFAVSVSEAGRLMDISDDAAWKLVRSHILRSVYVGRGLGRRVVLVADIQEYLARQAADHDADHGPDHGPITQP